jgi:conjugative relaxase-like TrwC/TraI family protein
MSVSINRLVGAKGAEYLLRTIAHGDGRSAAGSALTRYYAESGTPPGRWFGAGLTQLDDGRGIEAGSEVGEDQLRNMLGGGFDPVTMKPLGKVLSPYLKQTGPDGKPIERRSVTGFDLTFSVPKSVSAMWAIADGGTQAIIYEAHQEAIRQALVWAEEHVFFSRSGHNGVLQERIHGVVGAGFDHWDSRAADPQLHTHLVIQNRAKSVSDGQWRTLDSRAIYKATVTLSELHQVLLQDELTRRLGVGWDPRTRTHSHVPKWEVTGVSDALQAEFSQRSAAIAVHKDEQVAAFEATHSRKPTAVEVLRMRQAATLATREDKHEHSLADLTEQWRERARTYVGEDTVSFVESLARNDMPLLRADDLTDDMLTELGTVALTGVTEKRATFTRANVHAELSRRMAEIRFASAADRIAATERAATIAVESALRISADELHHTPDAYRDQKAGVSRFRGVGTELFTTTALLDAEHRLVETSHLTTGPRVNLDTIDATVGDDEHGQRRNMTGKKHGLSDEQLAAVADIATSGRIVDVLVGPAGTGKSTTMAGLRQAWEHHHGDGSVVGAAPSAAAAEVLSGELGIACENTAKWLTELAATGRRQAELHRLEHPTLTPEQARAAAQHAHTRLAAAEQTGNEATIKAAKQDYFDLLALT